MAQSTSIYHTARWAPTISPNIQHKECLIQTLKEKRTILQSDPFMILVISYNLDLPFLNRNKIRKMVTAPEAHCACRWWSPAPRSWGSSPSPPTAARPGSKPCARSLGWFDQRSIKTRRKKGIDLDNVVCGYVVYDITIVIYIYKCVCVRFRLE